jgi:hypothetical protein
MTHRLAAIDNKQSHFDAVNNMYTSAVCSLLLLLGCYYYCI